MELTGSSVAALLDDVVAAAADAVIDSAGGPAWDAAGFAARRDAARALLPERVHAVLADVERIVARWQAASSRLDAARPAVRDMRAQLDALVYSGFRCRGSRGAAHPCRSGPRDRRARRQPP